MPFKTYITKADYDSDYDIGAEPDGHPNTRPEIRLHYCRAVLYPVAKLRATGIMDAMGWRPPGPALVIVGAGFGWLAEALEQNGFTRVAGIDTSPYIHSDKNNSEASDYDKAIVAAGLDPNSGEGARVKADLISRTGSGPRTRASRGVLNQNGNTQQSRNAVRTALGLSGNQQPDWLLTDDMIAELTDAEFLQASTSLKNWVPNLAHFVRTADSGQAPGTFNQKPLEQWKALAPADTFIEKSTYRKL